VELLQRVFLSARFGGDLARECDDVGTVGLGHALALGRVDQELGGCGVGGGSVPPPPLEPAPHVLLRAVSACPLFLVSRATGTGARLRLRHPRGPEALALAAPHVANVVRAVSGNGAPAQLASVQRLLPPHALSARVALPACLFLEGCGGGGGGAPPLRDAAGASGAVGLLPAPRSGPLPPLPPLPGAPPPPPAGGAATAVLPSVDALRAWVRRLLVRVAEAEARGGGATRVVVGLAVDGDGTGGIARVALACGAGDAQVGLGEGEGEGKGEGGGEGTAVVVASARVFGGGGGSSGGGTGGTKGDGAAAAAAAAAAAPAAAAPPPPAPLSLFFPLLPLLLHPGVLKVVSTSSAVGCALDLLASAAGLPALHVLALDALAEEAGLCDGEWWRGAGALRCGVGGGGGGGGDEAAACAGAGVRAAALRGAALGCPALRDIPAPAGVAAAWARSELSVLALPLPRSGVAGVPPPPPPQPAAPWYLPCACCGHLAGHFVVDCPRLTQQ
jgi:hypothetical protein